MIVLDNGAVLDFVNMGQFIGGERWKHPEITVATYELIFVTSGEVFIEEGDRAYHLQQGDLLCLRPNVVHRGYRETDGTSFFWLHFYAEHYEEKIGVGFYRPADPHNYRVLFRQLGHLACKEGNKALIECRLATALLEIVRSGTSQSKLFSEVCEYIRINITSGISVGEISEHFRYSSDYLSRIFKKNSGVSLKEYLDSERNKYVQQLLLTTDMTLKEIAASVSFESDNALIKFFRYHNQTTPTQFRNSYHALHTNNH
jgi:AraC-like DNA-binding protein